MDAVALLQPRDGDSPSGDNLEYDPAFIDLELAAQPGEERQIGDEITDAEEPDYRDVSEKALGILERSHDLRAAVYLAQAELNTKGLSGLAECTAYIRGCLEQHWDSCHPQLDEDDDDDPTMRINAVQGLADEAGVVRALRRTPLTDSRSFGRMTLRMIEIAEGVITPRETDEVQDTSSVAAAFKDTDEAELGAFKDAAKAAAEDVKAIDAVFSERTPGQGPDLDLLSKTLQQITRRLKQYAGDDAAEEAGGEASESAPAAAGAAAARPPSGSVGGIASPNDVLNAIDRIVAYYQRNEPSSPVPILLERAKRLVNADFLTIVRDMAPSGLDNVNLIGGFEDDDD